jgi:hypothetical protein
VIERKSWGVRLFGAMLAAVPPNLARETLDELMWETGHRLRQWRRGHKTAVDLAESAAVALVQGYHFPRPAGLACPKCREAGVLEKVQLSTEDVTRLRNIERAAIKFQRFALDGPSAEKLGAARELDEALARTGGPRRRTYVPPKVIELGALPADGHCHEAKCETTLHLSGPGTCRCVCQRCVIQNVCGPRAPIRPAGASDTTPAPAPDAPPAGAPDWQASRLRECLACGRRASDRLLGPEGVCLDSEACRARLVASASNAPRQN